MCRQQTKEDRRKRNSLILDGIEGRLHDAGTGHLRRFSFHELAGIFSLDVDTVRIAAEQARVLRRAIHEARSHADATAP